MAFSVTTVWEVQTGGSDTDNGGGFDPSNANMINDLACDTGTGNTASPVVSSASYNFAAADVGHWVYVKSGANWTAGWYKIASVASNKATLDAAVGAAVLARGTPNTVVGVGTVATPTGGTWSVDYSQSTALAYTDLEIGSPDNSTLTSTAKPFGKNHVGNIISVTGGTDFTVQRVQIQSVSGTTASLDVPAGVGGSTGGTGGLGGPLASLGKAIGERELGNDFFVKSGTYVISVNTNNVSNGKISTGNGLSATNPTLVVGYGTVRGDNGTKPVLQLQEALAAGITVFTIGSRTRVENIEVDGNANATCTGFSTASASLFYRCKVQRCVTGISIDAFDAMAVECYATTCSTMGYDIGVGMAIACVARLNTGIGFDAAGGDLLFCVAADNDSHGVNLSAGGVVANCTVFSNGDAGITGPSLINNIILNTVLVSNTGNSVASTTNDSPTTLMIHCAVFGGTGITSAIRQIGTITLTADPFTDGANGDFSLNNTAGAGAACRQAGVPGTMPDTLSTGYIDIGAIQAQASTSRVWTWVG